MSRQFHRVEFGSRQAARPPQPEPEPQDNSEPPSDSMLVPVDQWNRILGRETHEQPSTFRSEAHQEFRGGSAGDSFSPL